VIGQMAKADTAPSGVFPVTGVNPLSHDGVEGDSEP
jgi:hypothetical protein